MVKTLLFSAINFGKKLFLTLLLIILLCNAMYAVKNQTIEVQRSTEKVLLEGKAYFIHVVKKGETLFSIAKAYNVSQPDIIAVNATAATGLRDEQILRIPETIAVQPATVKANDGTITHVVESGQTLYAISKKYNTSIDIIEKLNPEVKYDSLQINQVLRVQPNTVTEQPKTNNLPLKATDGFIIHKVEPQETIYSLSKKYNVEQDDITKANDGLKDGLKIGTFIRIPKSSDTTNSNTNNNTKPETETTVIPPVSENLTINPVLCDTAVTKTSGVIKIALLLPFFINAGNTNTTDIAGEEINEEKLQKQNDFNPVSVNFIEFYEGILVAIDKLKTKGISVELHLFDTERSVDKIKEVLQKPFLANCDIIIGPIFPEQLKPVADFALAHKTYMVSPITHNNDLLNNNPYYIEINPGSEPEYEAMANYICQSGQKDIYLVYPPNPAGVAEANKFKTYLNAGMQKLPADKQIPIKEINVIGNNYAGILQQLDSLQTNFVVSPIKDEIFANNLIRSLNSFLIFRTITVMGPKEWTKYKSMDLECFYNLEFRYFTPFHIDYTQNNTRNFLQHFRHLFETEPVKLSPYGFNYGMLGNDVATYFVNILAKYGRNFGNCINQKQTNMLLGNYNFARTINTGGFENQALQLVNHSKDYRVLAK